MKVKRSSTTFLKVIIYLAGIAVLALCIFLVPHMANFAAKSYPNIASIKYLVFIVIYGAAVPFNFALYQAFTVHWREHSVLGIICIGVKEHKVLCDYNQWNVCIRFATLSFYSEKSWPSNWIIGTHHHFCFVGYRRFCCYPPTASTRCD